MVATAVESGRRIHLAKATVRGGMAGTVCGEPYREIVDTKVSTGYPDCDECIRRVSRSSR